MNNDVYDPANGSNRRPTLVIPEGYKLMLNGYPAFDDLVWSPSEGWQQISDSAVIMGHPIKDFFGVCRKIVS